MNGKQAGFGCPTDDRLKGIGTVDGIDKVAMPHNVFIFFDD